jgi:hypothetical protein
MLKEKEEIIKKDYMSVVFAGCIVSYKNITLCDLTDHVPYLKNKTNGMYQVHSDNSKAKFSEIYYNIEEAVNKFIELKLQVMTE